MSNVLRARASSDPEAALKKLQLELSRVRHVSVSYLAGPEDRRGALPQSETASNAPDWLLNLFQPAMPVKSYPVNIDGRNHGELVVSTKPSDEAAEIWGSLVFLTALLGTISNQHACFGMSERIRKIGGRLNVRGGSRAGALIEAIIPLTASA